MPQRSKPSDSWAALMREQLLSRSRLPVGKGWKTTNQLRLEFGFGKGLMEKTLKSMVKQGKLDRFNGSECVEPGKRAYNQVWYRPKGMA